MTSTADGSVAVAAVDVSAWLKDNKLDSCAAIFDSRNIEVEELFEFDDNELAEFATSDLKLDTLAKKRFIRAIGKLRPQTQKSTTTTNIPQSSNHSNTHRTKKQVILSPAEHRGITKLFEKYDEVNELHLRISGSLQTLNESVESAHGEINVTFDNLLERLNARKKELLRDVDVKHLNKKSILEEQSNKMQHYIRVVDDGRNKYNTFVSNSSLHLSRRKKLIVSMAAEVLHAPAISMRIITQPKLQFQNASALKILAAGYDQSHSHSKSKSKSQSKHKNNDNVEAENADADGDGDHNHSDEDDAEDDDDEKENTKKHRRRLLLSEKPDVRMFRINDCDQPQALSLTIKKVTYAEISLTYALHELDVANNQIKKKRIRKIQLQHALLPKSFHSRRRTKRRRHRRKRSEEEYTDSEEESHSDSGSNASVEYSDSESEFGDFEESVDLDADQLRWVTTELKLKHKKRKKKKHKLEDLKNGRFYVLRIRAMNNSGFGEWSAILRCHTKKLVLKSKILKSKEMQQLVKFVPKGSRKKWKMIYRGSVNGFTGAQFHTVCNGKAPTVSVVQSTLNHVFGGYTEQPWSSSNAYKADPNAFIFLLRSSRPKEKMHKWKVKNVANSCYHHSSYGPTFGAYDFYLANACNTNNSSYANLGVSYEVPKDQTRLAGVYNFKVQDYEVFQLS